MISLSFSEYLISKSIQQKAPNLKLQNGQKQTSDSDDSLGSLIIIENPKDDIEIIKKGDSIDFEPYEDMNDTFRAFSIKREDHPKLFEQGVAGYSVHSFEYYFDLKNNKDFIIIFNKQPDHGSYSPVFFVINDLSNGKSVYESDDVLEGLSFPAIKEDRFGKGLIISGVLRKFEETGFTNLTDVTKFLIYDNQLGQFYVQE